MSLTGVPLLLLAALLTGAAGVVVVRLWSRSGVALRVVAVLLLEASLVLTAGLAVNRHEGFYPSWQALAGDTGTAVRQEHVRAGRLDDTVPASFTWRPPGWRSWHLAEPPTVNLPAGYRARADVAFPVLLSSVPSRTPEAVSVLVEPTTRTTPGDLLALAADLRRDLRVTTGGWAVDVGPLSAALTTLGVPEGAPRDLPPPLSAPLTLPSAAAAAYALPTAGRASGTSAAPAAPTAGRAFGTSAAPAADTLGAAVSGVRS
ncbi:hypothetical protein Aab01nite_39110 [Paractinoplanes abujensis]|uniref:Lysyl-tRNA synthetase class 2 n=1 Tax=Paractinoplanes abujensis TaxID=882441 RepID=A0A7W7G521_9ACTN|nr:hypothetical protein [Actinoplanes abujensis]MBB4694466.1 lysyl-tRNA synthetase class 2 [Actinoplanes abujensis]GID20321.1 hypothetical protein Aab01nite_39110 [Actinoplanes abujensis]